METWKPISGYEGLYEVSDTGKIKSIERKIVFHRKATGGFSWKFI